MEGQGQRCSVLQGQSVLDQTYAADRRAAMERRSKMFSFSRNSLCLTRPMLLIGGQLWKDRVKDVQFLQEQSVLDQTYAADRRAAMERQGQRCSVLQEQSVLDQTPCCCCLEGSYGKTGSKMFSSPFLMAPV